MACIYFNTKELVNSSYLIIMLTINSYFGRIGKQYCKTYIKNSIIPIYLKAINTAINWSNPEKPPSFYNLSKKQITLIKIRKSKYNNNLNSCQ